jgi:hypothetical protein
MWKLKLPYTIIDVGIWYQAAFPKLASGRVDYALIDENTTIYGDGDIGDALTDIRDVGKYVCKVINDDRTLNKMVFCCGEVLTQNEVISAMEEVSGEKIETAKVRVDKLTINRCEALGSHNPQVDPVVIEEEIRNLQKRPECGSDVLDFDLMCAQYSNVRFICGFNQPQYAEYLGYLDGRNLYPDFKPRPFKEYLRDLLNGKLKSPYDL